MERPQRQVITLGMKDSHRILSAMVVAAAESKKTLDCEECGRSFTPNEDETPYCEPCIAAAEGELDEAQARSLALAHYPKYEERDGKKGAGGLYVKDGQLVMLDRRGREIHTIYRSRKALKEPGQFNQNRAAARRLRQQERLAAKRARKAAR